MRTVRRYEQERELPVYRAPGKKGSTVFAYTSELDAWLESKRFDSGKKEQDAKSTQVTSDAALHLRNAREDNLPPPDVGRFHTTSAGKPQSERVSARRWQAWTLAGYAFLISFAALLWVVENHRTAAATRAVKLGTLKTWRHVPNPDAERFYLRGRYFWNLRTTDSLPRALDAYTQAIVKDPGYAEAYAGLAETYDLLPQFGRADLGDSLTRAVDAADRAIALNPDLADAHAAKAFALFYWNWDITGSDAEFRRALVLDPNSALTREWYASTLQIRNDGAECLSQIDQAQRLNPGSAAIAADAAYFHADFGNFGAGVKALKEIEQTQPTLASPAQFLRELDFGAGNFPAYIAEAQHFAAVTGNPEDATLARAVAEGWMQHGRTGLLQARAKVLQAAFDHGEDTGYSLGQNLMLLGYPKKALPYFTASLNRHSILLITMQDCPWAKALTHDPDYAALFAEIRKRVNGAPAQPGIARLSIRLPQ